MNTKTKYGVLIPVLFGFFTMGFVDVVGISTSYVKVDFDLNDKLANLLPMMVFVWFAIFSLPTGVLMAKIGRKKTVMISCALTLLAMLLPMVSFSFTTMLIAFALLGIGNTILQVSLNPLLMSVVDPQRVTSMLTLGQFIKAISSTLGPVLAGAAAGYFGNWKLIFPVYAAVTVLNWVWLLFTPIAEEKIQEHNSGNIGSLFRDPYLMMLLSVIILIVGFEIGLMTVVPKYLLERFDMPLEQGGLGCSLYYIARTVGTFLGSVILVKASSQKFLSITTGLAVGSFLLFMVVPAVSVVFVLLFAIGLLCANVFAIIFSAAMRHNPAMANQISALMIMGVAGGALVPPIMGVVADVSDQQISLIVPFVALVYIFITSFRIKK